MSTGSKANTTKEPRTRARKGKFNPGKAHRTVEEAINDILRFLDGREHLPNVPLQEDMLLGGLRMLLDNKLLSCLEAWEEAAVYRDRMGIDEDTIRLYGHGREFINQLRSLHDARLRDAIDAAPGLQQN